MTNDRPSTRRPGPAQESPFVWGLLVAAMLIAFVNFLFLALAEPTAYRIGLAVAAGAFLVVSVVQLVRSSRERRRRRAVPEPDGSPGSASGAAGGRPTDTGMDRAGEPDER